MTLVISPLSKISQGNQLLYFFSNLIPRKADKETLPDPFVVLTLYNGRSKVDRTKTKHQKTTLDPVFDET